MYKIQSISDVITNSSTEAFIVLQTRNLEDIKDLVNQILSISCNLTFDDLFTINLILDDYTVEQMIEWGVEEFIDFTGPVQEDISVSEYYNILDNLPLEKLNALQEYLEETYWDSNPRLFCDICVKAKNPTLERQARAIANIVNIFDVDYTYC